MSSSDEHNYFEKPFLVSFVIAYYVFNSIADMPHFLFFNTVFSIAVENHMVLNKNPTLLLGTIKNIYIVQIQ